MQGCAETSEFKSTFDLQEDVCYNFLDRKVWNSITNEPYPEDQGIVYFEGSFCGKDMCNVGEDACQDKNEKQRDILEPLGKCMYRPILSSFGKIYMLF